MADEILADAVMRLIQDQNQLEEEKEYRAWYAALLLLREDYKREPKKEWTADLELQPLRWMQLGLTLIQSPKITAYVQLANGVQGPPLSSFLPYPVFQAGAEIFLKGMWLCRYEDCRLLGHNSYIGPARRGEVFKELRNKLGHNLLQIIELLRGIREYQADETSSDFLKAIRALICRDYFPAFQADARGSEWASARYPKRFYNDEAGQAGADSFSHYPSQPFVERLFREAQQGVDDLWGLKAGLSSVGG
ncbi:MAG: hypothetical protein H0V54_01865 [Chthoniobacterales bacterium]|nr:hypothetical protein [Chthoniobacterales bacterium]